MNYHILGQSLSVPRAGHGTATFTMPEGHGLIIPRRLLARETPRVDCDYTVRARGLRMPDEVLVGDCEDDQPVSRDLLWPTLAPGDTVVVNVDDPGDDATVNLGLVLDQESEWYTRLAVSTPPLSVGESPTSIVFRLAESARIVRFEFETPDVWDPPGWNVGQITVGGHPQMMAEVDSQVLGGMWAHGVCAPRFATALIGTEIVVTVRRAIMGPSEALTVRAVLDPVRAHRRMVVR